MTLTVTLFSGICAVPDSGFVPNWSVIETILREDKFAQESSASIAPVLARGGDAGAAPGVR